MTKLLEFLFYLTFFVWGSSANPIGCSLASSLEYCGCPSENSELTLDCSPANSTDQLFSDLGKDFTSKSLKTFFMDSSNIEKLNRNTNGLSFEKIQLSRLPKLEEVTLDFLSDSTSSLKSILIVSNVIRGTSLREFPFSSISAFRKLKKLRIEHSLISTLQDMSSNSLTHFTLKFSKLTTLNENTLRGLTALRRLDLSYNELTALNERVIPVHTTNMKIQFQHNKISIVDDHPFDFVSNGENITRINLVGNELTRFDDDFYSDTLPTIHNIDVRDNPLDCENLSSDACEALKNPLMIVKFSHHGDPKCSDGVKYLKDSC